MFETLFRDQREYIRVVSGVNFPNAPLIRDLLEIMSHEKPSVSFSVTSLKMWWLIIRWRLVRVKDLE